MANRKVSLRIRINEGGRRPLAKPAYAANGRIRPLYALVDGVPQHRSEGMYYLRWADGERRVWEPVGIDPYAALAAKLRREHILESKSLGIAVVEPGKTNRPALADAIQKYLVRIHLQNGYRSQNEYDLSYSIFLRHLGIETTWYLVRVDMATRPDPVCCKRTERAVAGTDLGNRFARVPVHDGSHPPDLRRPHVTPVKCNDRPGGTNCQGSGDCSQP